MRGNGFSRPVSGPSSDYFCAGINPLGPSKKVKAAVRRAVKYLGSFPDPRNERLRSFFLSRFGISGEGIFFSRSFYGLLEHICGSVKPRTVLISGPAPLMYERAAVCSGAEVRYLHAKKENGFAVDAGEIRRELQDAELLFISNPSRITGRMTAAHEVAGIVSSAAEAGALAVVDETLIEYAGLEKLELLENAVVLRTTSAFYGLPGLELAYAAGAPDLIGRLFGGAPERIDVLTAEAAVSAYRDGAFKRASLSMIREEKRMMVRELRKIGDLNMYETDCCMMLLEADFFPGSLRERFSRKGAFLPGLSSVKGLDEAFLPFSFMGRDLDKKLLRLIREARDKASPVK